MTSSPNHASRPVAIWLLVVAGLIFAMVVIGGVTRLTRSGLSIVEWNPIMGVIPPITEHQWETEFEKYRQSPEYQHVNTGMSLTEFKSIYYVEWTHRLFGRLIGFVFLLPLLYFAVRRRIPRILVPKLVTIFLLGGLQGALGWFMVKSGLIDVPHVSPYRLTAHLALAVAIYASVVWMALDLLRTPSTSEVPNAFRRFGWIVMALVCVMILAGGFVAGTKAGFIFNTFPLMQGNFVPPGMYAMEPWWINNFENVATVQFNHRMLAYLLFIAIGVYWWWGRKLTLADPGRTALNILLIVLVLQITLGITTLLLRVPVWAGAAHQGGALVVLTAVLYLNHCYKDRAHLGGTS